MTSKNFVSGTVIDSAWLNDVNNNIYGPTAPVGTLRGDLSASSGSSAVGYQPAGTGAAPITIQAELRQRRSVLDFYANGVSGVTVDPTGVVDSTLGIQAAIDSLGTATGGTNGGVLYFPKGAYKVTSCLNLTTRDFIHLLGEDGANIVSTSATYIADCTSLGYSTFENLNFTSSTALVGLYFNRGTLRPTAEFNKIKNCIVTVSSNPTANSNIGTIAIYNCRMELFTSFNSTFQADCPLYADYYPKTGYLLPIYATVQAGGTGWDSLTVNSYYDCMFKANGNYTAPMILNNCLGFEFRNAYWATAGAVNGTNTYAIITSNMARCSFTGSCEGWPQFLHSLRVAQHLDIHIAIGAVTLNALGVINVDSVSTDVGGIINSNINIESTATSVAGSCVIYSSRPLANVSILNNNIIGNLPSIIAVTATLRLNGAIAGNVEHFDPIAPTINSVRAYAAIGAYVNNGTSYTYTMPAGVGCVEITGAYRYFTGSTDNQTVTVLLTRWNGGAPQAILKSSGGSGTNNRLGYALVGSVLTFTTSLNTSSCFIGYDIKEFIGDAA